MQKTLANVQQLNIAMQLFLREWSAVSKQHNPAQMLDQASLDWFAEMNRGLTDSLDDSGFKQRMDEMLTQLDVLAREIIVQATTAYPMLDGSKVVAFVNQKANVNGASMLFAQAA